MMAFLDFEASSLSRRSYPIEIGWVFEDGAAESHLIRPAKGWTDWDAEAEALHGLSRRTLTESGEDACAVAARMMAALGGHELFASAPSWDGKWLSALLRVADLPRGALRLSGTETAVRRAVREVLAASKLQGEAALEAATGEILRRARREAPPQATRHRALPDAQGELALWSRAVGLAREAFEVLGALEASPPPERPERPEQPVRPERPEPLGASDPRRQIAGG